MIAVGYADQWEQSPNTSSMMIQVTANSMQIMFLLNLRNKYKIVLIHSPASSVKQLENISDWKVTEVCYLHLLKIFVFLVIDGWKRIRISKRKGFS